MKNLKYSVGFLCIVGIGWVFLQQRNNPPKVPLSLTEDLSMCVASQCWHILHFRQDTFDLSRVTDLLHAFANGTKVPLEHKEACTILADHAVKMEEERLERNDKRAREFLQKIALNAIEIVPDNLYYTVLKEGAGPAITAEDHPTLHFHEECALTQEIMQNTYSAKPICLHMCDMVPALRKSLIGMQVGEKRRIYTHPYLAYGRAYSLNIPSAIIYEVEIVALE